MLQLQDFADNSCGSWFPWWILMVLYAAIVDAILLVLTLIDVGRNHLKYVVVSMLCDLRFPFIWHVHCASVVFHGVYHVIMHLPIMICPKLYFAYIAVRFPNIFSSFIHIFHLPRLHAPRSSAPKLFFSVCAPFTLSLCFLMFTVIQENVAHFFMAIEDSR